MNESEFNHAVDAQLIAIEEAIEASGADIDFDTVSGILTLEFANGSKIIINRQTPARQIWVATRSGGYHFDLKGESWVDDRSGEDLMERLSRAASEQAGEPVVLA